MVRRKNAADAAILIILLIIAFACLLPVVNTIAVSLSEKDAAASGRVFLWPVKYTSAAYEALTREPQFGRSFMNSVLRVAIGAPLNVALTVLTAYPLSRSKKAFPQKYAFLWFLMVALLFDGGLVPRYLLVSSLGLIDTVWSLVLPGALPVFCVIVLMNFFKGVPDSLEEAAFMDGANPYQIMLFVFVPLALPAIAVIALFSVVSHWNSFFDGLIYMNSSFKWPLQTYISQLNFSVDYQRMGAMDADALAKALKMSGVTFNSAKLVVSMAPILLIYPFLQRYFVAGVAMGAVKE
ncbi:MAG: carbohydrate ABC transporter permease [Clostridiales bacterium]|jgi:ABC-type glycerol-3-phosphate transport system permease component|nr:carbohydrate ABC transporter permease [Clostridiales bacterium]